MCFYQMKKNNLSLFFGSFSLSLVWSHIFFMKLSRIQPGQALSIMTLHYACGDLSTPNLCFPSCHLTGKLGFLLFSKNPWIICRELCTLKLLVSTWLLTDTGTDSVLSSLALRTDFSDFFFSCHSSSTVKALGSVSKPTTLSWEGIFFSCGAVLLNRH